MFVPGFTVTFSMFASSVAVSCDSTTSTPSLVSSRYSLLSSVLLATTFLMSALLMSVTIVSMSPPLNVTVSPLITTLSFLLTYGLDSIPVNV